ncbi:unnamed protein product [Brassica rapa]|uniref:Uncharacterized protein n=1 Tax=Brassica campestris TaxID=3711 RepID=A0A3P6C4M9_BRACM|nr:unnamed protein product [Brassica rapa]VDD03442.1 unnamed protein product [Brassica rapa]
MCFFLGWKELMNQNMNSQKFCHLTLYERFVNALDELSDDTLRDLKEKALKVYPIIVKTLAFLLRKTSSQSVKTNP